MNFLNHKIILVAATLLILGLVLNTESAVAAPNPQTNQNIIQTLAADGRFTTLLIALEAADLTNQLENQGPFTLFAPTDAAFDSFSPLMFDALVGDPLLLTNILNYHITPQQLSTADIAGLDTVNTLFNRDLALSNNNSNLTVNGASVVAADINASNGLIHAIDRVLLPPGIDTVLISEAGAVFFGNLSVVPRDQQTMLDFVSEGDRLTRLELLIRAADLAGTLDGAGPFTLFAPIDAAFADLPPGTLESLLADETALRRLLLYHIAPQGITTNNVPALDSAGTVLGDPLTFSVVGAGEQPGDTMMQVNYATLVAADLPVTNGVVHLIDEVLFPPAGALAEDAVLLEGELVTCSEAYQVQADDWLSKIADKFYGDPLAFSAIFDATNAAVAIDPQYDPITDPNVINVGQTLCIPPADSAAALLFEDDLSMDPDNTTVGEIVASREELETLTTALESAGMLDTLQGEGPFTLFAPTNAAFENLPAGQFAALLADTQALKSVLAFHVVPSELTSDQLQQRTTLDTTLNQPLTLAQAGDEIQVNGSHIESENIEAVNGVIHIINQVLLPATE